MIWQTKKWGEMLLASKQAESIFDVEGIQVEKRSIGLGQYGLFILGLDKVVTGVQEEKLEELCKKEKALFIQVEYLNYSDKMGADERVNNKYYKKFITPYTAVIDLENTEEEILAKMKPKGRYNIRLAEKKGVEVKSVEKNQENIKKFYILMKETTSRDNFSGNTLEYYKSFLSLVSSSELLLAYKDSEVVAAGIFIIDSEVSIYYYGASSSNREYRKIMAPYLLQWKAISLAKEKGSKIYDFLGVADPSNSSDPLIGVTDFKKKFTKDIRKVSTSDLYICNRFLYTCLSAIKKIKTIIKK